MQDDVPTPAPNEEAAPGEQARADRSARQRERFRQSQLVAAQVARSRAAGGAPNDAEAARLVEEFHAKGGSVTVCPPGDPPSDNKPER